MGDRHVGNVLAGCVRQLGGDFREGQHAGPGHLVDLAHMTGFGKCGHCHLGNIFRIDVRLRRIDVRQRDLPRLDQFQECALGKILVEPASAHDGPVDAAVLNDVFADLRLFLAATGEQNQVFEALAAGLVDERPDRIARSGHRQVRRIADVRSSYAIEALVPVRLVAPVECRNSGA